MPEHARGAITLDHAGFSYANGLAILRDVSVEVAPGSILALVGRSGAGKSTLLKLINRMLLPTNGSVRVDGRETGAWDEIRLRRQIGYVLQDVGLFPHMTVAQNVGLVPRLEGWQPDRIETRVKELLSLVGLPFDAWAQRWPRELSGWQRQRVGVARALAVDPPMLLMDEPFSALDPVTRAEVRREFARIQQTLGTTVVMVTHDMAEAFALASHVGVLDDGLLVSVGPPDDIRRSDDPRVRVFL
ncbi:MAG: ATP-binding cassette domain-containing protein [Vicinamibacterales bacterium]